MTYRHQRGLRLPMGRPPSGPRPLTQQQHVIARMVASGLTNGEIADRLHVTHGTVANHVAHILQRLGLRNRTQIAMWNAGRSLLLKQPPCSPIDAEHERLQAAAADYERLHTAFEDYVRRHPCTHTAWCLPSAFGPAWKPVPVRARAALQIDPDTHTFEAGDKADAHRV